MLNRKLNLILIPLMMLMAAGAGAVEMEAGGRILVANPVGDFGDATDNLGAGLEGHWGVRPNPYVTIGLGANVMTYGCEERDYDLPLVDDFEMETTNNMAGGFLFAQVRPMQGVLQPYVEGRVGFNYIWTESSLQDDDWWDSSEVGRETNFDDFAGYVAGGGGLLFQLKEGGGGKKGIFLDLKMIYQKGSKAEYLTEGDVEIVDNRPVYNVSRSETDLINYQLGVTVTF